MLSEQVKMLPKSMQMKKMLKLKRTKVKREVKMSNKKSYKTMRLDLYLL